MAADIGTFVNTILVLAKRLLTRPFRRPRSVLVRVERRGDELFSLVGSVVTALRGWSR